MCALALAVIGQALVSGGPTLASLWAGTRWRKVALVVALLLVYGVAFERIGFIPCTLVLLLILMWFVDPVKWWLAIVIAFAATFGVWAALTKWLKIQLPSGILNGII
jgi:putative tricarboxylic transport membrane protein